ncbi:MAG: indolepyruvate oxidoreductase subunit beta [Succinivibrio sp.]
MNKNVLICGVGGQGTVLASRLTASAAMKEGNVVHSAETIGMAQRGGAVTSHVRIGEQAFSPLIPDGKADLILAFEPAEAVRNIHYLKKGGTVIVCSHPVKPVTESLEDTGYDGKEMLEFLKQNQVKTCVIDANEILKEFCSLKFLNIIILGAAVGAGVLGISEDTMTEEIEQKVKARFVEVNKKAFAAGVKKGKEYAAKQ